MKILRSFLYAFDGLRYSFKTQRHMKFHLLAAVFAIIFACKFELNSVEKLILILTISSVIIAELFNTSIEAIVDKLSPEYHPLAKIAKDVAASAVLISALASLAVGYYLFFDKLL